LEDTRSMVGMTPLQPNVLLANNLLPENSGDVYLVASSQTETITGVVFVFDSEYFEPAIGNASGVVPKLPPTSVYAITDVTVVPMDTERVLNNQTVIVRDRLIVAMGPATTTMPPEDAIVIDGSGKFLMPGLTDCHTHVQDEGDLVMNIANGVTTILNMGDTAYQSISMKTRLQQGEIQGPTLYNAMFIRGQGEVHLTPFDEQQTRTLARHAKEMGYDFLKPYNVGQATFDVLMDEAAKLGMPAVGHMHPSMSLDYILAGGQSMIAHAEEYKNNFFGNQIDYDRIDDALEVTLHHGTTVTSTISTLEAVRDYGNLNAAGYAQLLARPGVTYLNPSIIDAWNATYFFGGNGLSSEYYSFLNVLLKEFLDNGVPLILGTDSPVVPGMVSGFAMQQELRVLCEAGWRPYDILRAATANAGEFIMSQLPNATNFGTVAVGSRADLILLQSNPLEDVARVKDRLGVMVRGQWFEEAQLQQMLDGIISRYQQPGATLGSQ